MHEMCTDVSPPGNTWHHFTLGVATDLKTVVLRTPVNEWLDPMKEASSNEGAFLVPVTPPSGRHRGWGTWRVWGVDIFSDGDTSMTQEPPFSQFRPS